MVFFGALGSVSRLPCRIFFLKLTTTAIIYYCLDPHKEKGKEKGDNGKREGMPADRPRMSRLSTSLTFSALRPSQYASSFHDKN